MPFRSVANMSLEVGYPELAKEGGKKNKDDVYVIRVRPSSSYLLEFSLNSVSLSGLLVSCLLDSPKTQSLFVPRCSRFGF